MIKFSPADARVLIVDDREANVMLLEDILDEAGYSQRCCITDSRQALAAYEEFRPDLILLDLMMPHLDGFAVMEKLNAVRAGREYLPILVLTADINPKTKQQALAAGAKDFLTKPFDAVEVLLRVKNLLETRFLYVQMEQEIRARTREIHEKARLIDEARDALIAQDLDGRIVFWSNGAERTYGWKAEEALGKNAADLLSMFNVAELAGIQKAFAETGQWNGELCQKNKSGKQLIVESRWTVLADEQGKQVARLIINTDITQKKETETRVLRAQRMESIGLLAGGIAHDLNNVLTPLMMGLELLAMARKELHADALFATMQASVQRGASLVKQITAFARGVEGTRQPLHLSFLVSELTSLLLQTFPKSISIKTSLPKDLWLVTADGTQLHQVLTNLCVNARDAMKNGGQLTIAARNELLDDSHSQLNSQLRAGRYVVIEVEDTGAGIPDKILDRIFEPFFTTKDIGEGTGLGLPTTLGIVRSHQGSVHVFSEVGKGTRFCVYLPAIESSVGSCMAAPEKDLPRGKGELILVVEDEPALQNIANIILTKFGYRVITANDGAEGLAAYHRHRGEIDLVLTDMNMPVMSGRELIDALLRLNPGVKIVANSGLTPEVHGGQPSIAGAQAFLLKPYGVDVLLRMVQSTLKSSSRSPNEFVQTQPSPPHSSFVLTASPVG